jgi:hypothetical protein
MTHDEAATYVFPDGQFAGLTVAQVAASDEGLLHLWSRTKSPSDSDTLNAIRTFLLTDSDAYSRLATLLMERDR